MENPCLPHRCRPVLCIRAADEKPASVASMMVEYAAITMAALVRSTSIVFPYSWFDCFDFTLR